MSTRPPTARTIVDAAAGKRGPEKGNVGIGRAGDILETRAQSPIERPNARDVDTGEGDDEDTDDGRKTVQPARRTRGVLIVFESLGRRLRAVALTLPSSRARLSAFSMGPKSRSVAEIMKAKMSARRG